MTESSEPEFGRYTGRLILEPLSDGRLMRVVEPFGFVERSKRRWPVPVDARVDGASIPQPLWSILGGPFEGKYRDASVVHDYYCDVRTQPWKEVHRVFYLAMRCSGVSEARAKLMFAAVYFAGPRWSDTTVANARLPRDDDPNIMFSVRHGPFAVSVLDATSVDGTSAHDLLRAGTGRYPDGTKTTLSLGQLQEIIASVNPDLEQIEMSIDSATHVLESPVFAEEQVRLLDTSGVEWPAPS